MNCYQDKQPTLSSFWNRRLCPNITTGLLLEATRLRILLGGGGRILDSHSLKHKRFSSGAINRLKVLDERNPVKVVLEAFIEKKRFSSMWGGFSY